MNKYIVKVLILLAMCTQLAGCMTCWHGRKQDVMINSLPQGAEVIVDGHSIGATPLIVTLTRKEHHQVYLRKEGYVDYSIQLRSNVDPLIAINILPGAAFGGGCWFMSSAGMMANAPLQYWVVPGLAYTGVSCAGDLLLGGGYKLSSAYVGATLMPLKNNP